MLLGACAAKNVSPAAPQATELAPTAEVLRETQARDTGAELDLRGYDKDFVLALAPAR
jgi:hypothetical protein